MNLQSLNEFLFKVLYPKTRPNDFHWAGALLASLTVADRWGPATSASTSACRPTVGLDQGDATTGAGRRGDHRRRHGWGRRPSACGSDLTHAFDASHYGELKPGGAATIRPSERRTRRRQAASGGGPRRWWSTRELEGQRGCPGGPAAHPRRVYVLGFGGGGLQRR